MATVLDMEQLQPGISLRKHEYLALAFAAAAGSLIFGAIPLAVGAAVTVFGGAASGGIAAATELAAMGMASLWVTARLQRLRARPTIFIAILLLVPGECLSAIAAAGSHWWPFLGARVLVGLGEGGLFTVANALAAQTPRPDRTFTLFAFVQNAVIASFYAVMTWINPTFAPTRVFVIFAASLAMTSLGALAAPNRRLGAQTGHSAATPATPLTPAVKQSLLGVGVYGCAVFMLYPYVEQVGLQNGLQAAQIAVVLGFTSIAALLGPGVMALVGLKLGRWYPMLTAILIQAAASLILVYTHDLSLWSAAQLSSITFLYVLNPLLFALVAHLEPSGRANGMATAIQSATAAVGPTLAGTITAISTGYIALGWATAIAYLILAAILWRPHRIAAQSS